MTCCGAVQTVLDFIVYRSGHKMPHKLWFHSLSGCARMVRSDRAERMPDMWEVRFDEK